jgi:MFS family permease
VCWGAAMTTVTPDVVAELETAPVTRTHKRLWVLASLGIFLDGFDLFILGIALPLIREDWGINNWEAGLLASSAVLGAIVGASVIGRLTDRIGRRVVFAVDLAAFVVFAALSGLAWNVWSLIAIRFLLGAAVGADYPISASVISEIMPTRIRGRSLVGAFSFQAVGMVAGALTGIAMLVVIDDVGAWRWILAMGAVPALVVVWLRRGSPESPRWLLSAGETTEAASVMSKLLGRTVDPVELEGYEAEPIVPWRTLFGARLRRRTTLTAVPWFLMDIATYGVGLFTPTIIAALIVTGNNANTITDDLTSAEGSALVDLFLILGFVIAIVLVERAGRIRLQVGGFVFMAVGLAVLALASRGGGVDDAPLVWVLLGFAVFNLAMNAGPNSTTFALPAEIFPTEMRASGHGFAAACGKAGAAVGTFLFPVLIGAVGLATVLGGVAVLCLLGAAVTVAFRVEPAGQALG